MTDGFAVDAEQIRAHARNVDALRGRFDAVKTASAHIAQDDSAYGLLCSWMPAILEGRHKRQDELIAYVEENLSLVVQGLHRTADAYDNVDTDADATIRKAGGGLTRSAQ
ncbi:type VII secretion target [Micromonospora yasonensis]|uniref:type VII secretion target n=1 Tax=Micromonospora yasonensis TaxID=1128667 RepID=UPI00222FBA19|nr:type VII secretion target [Micromonospora yasonensis]MCW3844571.1 type VII secretion target [Micromonospora yasonensis]